MFGAVVKGEPGLGLFDKGASLIASNKGITFSLLVMGNLDYIKWHKRSTFMLLKVRARLVRNTVPIVPAGRSGLALGQPAFHPLKHGSHTLGSR